MINFKKRIAEKIAERVELQPEEIQEYIEIPPNRELGDYAFPCFRLAKILKKSPQEIANYLKEKIDCDAEITRRTSYWWLLEYFNQPKVIGSASIARN